MNHFPLNEAGVKAQDLCRKYGISDATFYKYKARFGGMNVSDAKKLRALEDENGRLKRMLAEAMLKRGLVRHWSEDNGRARHSRILRQKTADAWRGGEMAMRHRFEHAIERPCVT